MNICLICLRTNRMLMLASDVLKEFHAELCDFSAVTTTSCYYCRECEYTLTKFYKFKQKCEEALQMYQKWNSTKNKQPINLLYTLLPPSPLGMWKPNPKKIGNFTIQGKDSQTDMCVENGLIKNTYPREDKIINVRTYPSKKNVTLVDVPKTKNITKNVPELEQTDEIQNDGKSEECLFESLEKLVDDSDESTNLNDTEYDTEDSESEEIDEIQNYGKPEECLFDNLEKLVDDSDESTNLNVTDYDTEDSDLEQMDEIQNDDESEERLFDNLDKQVDDSEECTNLNVTQYDTEDSVLKQMDEIQKDHKSEERLFDNLEKQVDVPEACTNLNVTQHDTEDSVLKQIDEIQNDGKSEECLFDNVVRIVDGSEESANLNVTQHDTEDSVLKQIDEIQNNGKPEECLFDNVVRIVDGSEESTNLNVTQHDTEDSVLKQIDEIQNDGKSEECLFDNVVRIVDGSEESTNLNVTQHDTEDSVLKQIDEIQNDGKSEECLFDNVVRLVDGSEESTNLNVTQHDTEDSFLKQIDEIQNNGKPEECLFDNVVRLVDGSGESTNLNVTQYDTGGSVLKQIKMKKKNEIQKDRKSEGRLFEYLLLVKQVNGSKECAKLNVTKHATKNSNKKTKTSKAQKVNAKKNTAKKNKEIIENGLKPNKYTTRKKIARMKAQLDKVIEKDKMYESVFDIEYLTTHEMRLEEFQRRKTYECYVNAEHKCEICYQVVKSAKILEYHTNNWHNETPGTVCCPICKIWSTSKNGHRRTHSEVFKCKLCLLVTYRRTPMQLHFYNHQGKQYNCEQCNTTFKSMSAYYSHNSRHHKNGRNVCERCGREFNTLLGLTIHKSHSSRCTAVKGTSEPKETTEGVRCDECDVTLPSQQETTEGVRCDECDVTLPSQQIYEAHISNLHDCVKRRTRGTRIPTDSAGLPEYSAHNVRRKGNHIRIRTAKHTCRVCNKVGFSYGWLKAHLKREHPDEDINVLYADKKKHLCDICGAGFSNVYTLRSHMTKHTALPVPCDICLKRFRSAILMRDHRLRHFPFEMTCTHCGKQFKTKSNLHNHMKIHTGERNHKCTICDKAFRYSSGLREHVQGVHYHIRRVRKRASGSRPGKRTKRRKISTTTEEETDSDFS